MPLYKALDIGDRIPDFELQDQHGQWIKREDFEGKPLVIFFIQKTTRLAVPLKRVHLEIMKVSF